MLLRRTKQARPAPDRTRLDSLTGLRIFAAAWVMLLHFRSVTEGRTWPIPFIDRFVLQGAYAVDMFFVLSGFILSHVYFTQFRDGLRGERFRSFISYRFARLYPVHLVTFGMMVVLFFGQSIVTGSSTADSGRYSVPVFLSSLTMTHAWWGSGTTTTPNIPAWSISAEWFAYLLFPFLCLAVKRLRRFAPLVFTLAGLGLALLWHVTDDNPLVRVMAGFLVGMAAFQISRLTVGTAKVPVLGTVVLALVVVWATVGAARLEIGILLFACLILVLATERDWLCRIFSLRWVVYLGEVSYAVYMVHWVVRVVVRTAAEKAGVIDTIPPGLLVATYVFVTLGAAMLLYHFVERPWRRRLRALLAPRATAKAQAKTQTGEVGS
jgi:peptidoglycan/LPS O-acetylase OafA/YrhL